MVAIGALTLVLYASLGIPLRSPRELYLTRLQGGIAWYGLGLVLALLVTRVSGERETMARSFERFRSAYLRPQVMAADLRAVHAAVLVFFLFLELKHLTPHVNPRLYDGWFVAGEEAAFGPGLAARSLQQALGPDRAWFVSELYALFYPYLGFLLMLMVMQRDSKLRERFLFAFALTWFIGVLAVYAVPTLGPCFVRDESVSLLPATPSRELQRQLWKHYLFVTAHPASTLGLASISAVPSLHVAIVLLGTLFIRKISRAASLVSVLVLAATVVSTIYLGWHYLLDDVVAVPLVLVAQALSRRAIR